MGKLEGLRKSGEKTNKRREKDKEVKTKKDMERLSAGEKDSKKKKKREN